ncbi:hypothetical protein IGI04_034883, partial [Brassica rapa subsp. trilocularis]
SFALAFQFRQFEVSQHPVSEVMHVLLNIGQSTSREEVVEEMNDCRSMKQHWHRSTVMPERGPIIISRATEAHKPQEITKIPMDEHKSYLFLKITRIDRSPLNCVDRQSFKSIGRHLTVLVGTHIKVRYTEPKLTSNTKPDTTACLGAWSKRSKYDLVATTIKA